MPQHLLLPLFATLAGIAFGILGVAYRLAQNHKLRTSQIMLICAVAGTLFFALQSPPPSPMATFILVLAVVSGVTQYLALHLIQKGLQLGPLSPIWCMVSLYFIPPAIYSCFVYKTPLGTPQILGILLASGCAVLASLQSCPDATGHRTHPLLYPVVLLAVFIFNSFMNVVFADMKARPGYETPLFETHTNQVTSIMYASIAICIAAELAVSLLKPRSTKTESPSPSTPGTPFPWLPFLLLGLLAALASNSGLLCLRLSGNLPAATTFTLSGITGLLTGGLASVLLFRERPTPRWYAMMLFGLAAVPLVNLH